jgi:hypothetical protein
MNKLITLLQLGFIFLFLGLFVKETPIKLQVK